MALHTVYLALGSNLGDRAANIRRAIHALHAYAPVQATSFLYETPPSYVTAQPPFLNAVCRLSSHLAPHELLLALKRTEQELGRQATVRYGPRAIDLDILFYDALVMESAALSIPHPALAERGFVLQPLLDLDPALHHPGRNTSVQALWERLGAAVAPRVTPVGRELWRWGAKTYVMGIVNVTPDSFAGDGLMVDPRSAQAVLAAAVAQGVAMVAEGADCLDVGGLSTRPGHALISVQEEIDRVVPVVAALAAAVQVPISVDTFRGEVAQAALDAGANLINDIWGLGYDSQVGVVAASAGVPLVLVHNHTCPEEPAYRARLGKRACRTVARDLVDEVQFELMGHVSMAEALGMPRWLLMIDPGIGYGKSLAQQLVLIRRLAEVRALGYPLLFAASRKGFIGRVLDLPVAERVEGTLAVNLLAIDRGADIVRVHDVLPMVRAARMVDAVVRS